MHGLTKSASHVTFVDSIFKTDTTPMTLGCHLSMIIIKIYMKTDKPNNCRSVSVSRHFFVDSKTYSKVVTLNPMRLKMQQSGTLKL